ncbi:MAG: O-antigen ligase family protein [Candidatus Omnitrophota bacterium]
MVTRSSIIAILAKISEWAVYIIIFVLPFSKSLIEIAAVTAIVSLISKKILAKESLLGHTHVDILLYIFIFANLFSFINTAHLSLSLRALFSKTLEYAVLFLIVKEVINTKEKLRNFLIIAAVSCTVILIDGFIQYYITHIDLLHAYPSFRYVQAVPDFLGVPTASFPYPNDFASWIFIFIFPTCVLAIFGFRDITKRVFFSFVCSALLFSLYLTKVRGAWAAFLLTFALLTIFKLKKIGLIILVALFLAILVMHSSLMPYIMAKTSINDRMEMWRNGWEIFERHPIIGNGLNTFFVHYREVRDDAYKNKRGSYAHNCYLQMASDIGLVGLVSFFLFAFAVIAAGIKATRAITEPFYNSLIMGTTFGLIAFLLHAAVDTNLYSLNLAVLFWMTAGILMASIRVCREGL